MLKHEMDLNGLIIMGLKKVGLARNIIFADGYLGDRQPVLSADALTDGPVDSEYPSATDATA